MPLFYLSFCDANKPKGTQFLGGCIVRADDMMSAVPVAWLEGCNPGGEAMILEIPKEAEHKALSSDMNRLLSKEEIAQKWGVVTQEELDDALESN